MLIKAYFYKHILSHYHYSLQGKTPYIVPILGPINGGIFICLVHLAGIEPVRVAPLDPKSSASASSAIGAFSLKEGTCPS